MSKIENVTYDEIEIGRKVSYNKTLSEEDLILFAKVCGDVNPVHLDAEFAKTSMFGERIAHGMYTGSLISAVLGVLLPGPGTIYLGQTLRFSAPVKIGDTLTVIMEVIQKRDDKKFVTMDCVVENQHGKKVASGVAEVIAPTEKIIVDQPVLPPIMIG